MSRRYQTYAGAALAYIAAARAGKEPKLTLEGRIRKIEKDVAALQAELASLKQ